MPEVQDFADSGLRIKITLRGETVADSILTMIPAKGTLLQTIQNIIALQVKAFEDKV